MEKYPTRTSGVTTNKIASKAAGEKE